MARVPTSASQLSPGWNPASTAFTRSSARASAPAWRAVLLCAAGPEGASAAPGSALRREGVDPDAALDEAEERGVLVRDCSAWPRLAQCLRVTVGTPDENDAFLDALHASIGEVAG